MKVKQLGPNQTLVVLDDTREIFFSYETPVAGRNAYGDYYRTQTKYSPTTSRHINKYLDGCFAVPLPQSQIDALAKQGEAA